MNDQQIVGAINGFTFDSDQTLPAGAGSGLFGSGLNNLDIRGTSVNSISDAVYFNGNVTALGPVPLPSAFWLLGPALSGLGILRRRAS